MGPSYALSTKCEDSASKRVSPRFQDAYRETIAMLQVHAIPASIVLAAALIAAVMDIWKLKIHNALTLPLLLSGLAYHVIGAGMQGLLGSLMGVLSGFAVLSVFYTMGGVGAGDVKLMAAVGAWLGTPLTLYVFASSPGLRDLRRAGAHPPLGQPRNLDQSPSRTIPVDRPGPPSRGRRLARRRDEVRRSSSPPRPVRRDGRRGLGRGRRLVYSHKLRVWSRIDSDAIGAWRTPFLVGLSWVGWRMIELHGGLAGTLPVLSYNLR